MTANATRGVKIVDLSTLSGAERGNRNILRFEGGVLKDMTGKRSSVDLDLIEKTGTLEDITGKDPKTVMSLLREGAGTIHDATNENPAAVKAMAARAGGIVEASLLLRSDSTERGNGTLKDVTGVDPATVSGLF